MESREIPVRLILAYVVEKPQLLRSLSSLGLMHGRFGSVIFHYCRL
jgi:hypothetical protein